MEQIDGHYFIKQIIIASVKLPSLQQRTLRFKFPCKHIKYINMKRSYSNDNPIKERKINNRKGKVSTFE